jgi:hypothetical protein
MEAVEQGQGLVHDIGTDLVGGLAQGSGLAGRWRTHTEHVNSFSSTRLPLLLVPSAMVACASVWSLGRDERTPRLERKCMYSRRRPARVTKARVAQACSERAVQPAELS